MADDAPPPSAPLWIVSFGDMISNMVTFFILLAAFSTPSAYETNVRDPQIRPRELGIFKDEKRKRAIVKRPVSADAKLDTEGPENPSRRKEEIFDRTLDRFVQDKSFSVKPEFDRLKDGLRVTFAADRLFAPGDAVIRADAADVLEEIGRCFRGEDCTFVVEAHADSRSHRLAGSDSPVDMSRRMALAAAAVLVERAEVPPHKVAVEPRGALEPIASDDEAAGRAKNRRVAILVRHGS